MLDRLLETRRTHRKAPLPFPPIALDVVYRVQDGLREEGVVYEMSGQIMATNTAAEVRGNPLNSLAWLANHLAERGLGLRAGDLVMSGSISALPRPKAGDVVTARFTRVGSVSARFV